MKMLETNGCAKAPKLASGDGKGENARCNHNVNDGGHHKQKIIPIAKLLRV